MTSDDLKHWRITRVLSQAEAAKRIGCSRRGYQRWESGKSPIPKYIAMAVAAVSMNLPPYGRRRRKAASAH